MNALFLYLLESAICVSVLYAIYWFFLMRDTFFRVNRFYLIAMVVFSILFPLLPLRWTPSDPTTVITVLLEPVIVTPARLEQTLQAHLQWIEIAAVVYFTGVLIFLLRFALQLTQLFIITRQFGISKRNGQRVVFIDRGYAPFSFFNLVFINEGVVSDGSLRTILEHETVHMQQYHSLDMILIELSAILQWFNPIMWLAGREMKSIHEYLADEAVLQNGISRSRYQQMILDETMGIRVNNLTNNFNVSLLKKRIAMMTKSKSKTWAKGKVLIAVPVLLVLGFLLTAHTYSNIPVPDDSASPALTQAGFVHGPGQIIQDKPKTETQIKYVDPKTGKEVYTVVDKQPVFPGGFDSYSKFLISNIKYPEEALKKGVTGTVFITFVIEKDGSVTNVKILRGIGSGCDEEAFRVVKMMPNWVPGELKGKPVAVQFNLPIKFNLDSEKKDETKK